MHNDPLMYVDPTGHEAKKSGTGSSSSTKNKGGVLKQGSKGDQVKAVRGGL